MNNQLLKYYSIQGLCRALDVFNYPEDHLYLTRILAYRFLFQHKEKEPDMIPTNEELLKSIKKMVTEYLHMSDKITILLEIVDVLLEFSKEDGEELLIYLQKSKLVANKHCTVTDGTKATIYDDSQSAHNKSLNESLRKVAKYLCKNYCPVMRLEDPKARDEAMNIIKEDIIMILPNDIKLVDEVFNRISCDNAIYGEINGFPIHVDVILFSLWNFIRIQGKTNELRKRVAEEICEMHNYCSSRILGGLLNSIQGFTDDENLSITISIDEQCKAVVYTYLDKKLQQCEDEAVIDGMLEKNKVFINYMVKAINEKRIEWMKTYGEEFSSKISKIANEYTKIRIFETDIIRKPIISEPPKPIHIIQTEESVITIKYRPKKTVKQINKLGKILSTKI